jgi:hypothetical protein
MNEQTQTAASGFKITLPGPPGIYTVLSCSDLAACANSGGAVANGPGTSVFTDTAATLSLQKFYRALLAPPAS